MSDRRLTLRSLDGRRLALILLLIAAITRFGNLYFQSDSPLFQAPVSDEFEHFRAASTLAGGDWLGRTIGPYHRPQLFAYATAVLFHIFGTSFLVTHLFICLVDTFAVLAWFAVARRAFPRTPAFLGALFIALYWTFVHFSGTGYMESFAMALNALFLLYLSIHASRAVRKARQASAPSPWPPLIAAGILGGLSILTRPTVLLLMPPIGLLLWWLHARARWFRPVIVPTIILAAVVTITISPNAIRHWVMFHIWAPLGTGSELNFHMSNNRDGWGWEVSSPGIEFKVYQNVPIIEGGVAPRVADIRAFWAERNRAYLREEPLRFIGNLGHKFLVVLNAHEVHCTNDFEYTRDRSPILRWLPGFGLLGILGIGGLLISLPLFRSLIHPRQIVNLNTAQSWTRLLLSTWVIVYLVGVALYLAISRHRLPALPPLMLLGGWMLWSLYSHLWRKRLAPALIAALVAGVIATRLPVIPASMAGLERWWTQVNLGVALMALQRPDEAVTELQRGVLVLPNKLESWRQLALAHAAAGNPGLAVLAQVHLLELFRAQYPAYYMIEAEILEELVRMKLAAGDPAGAVETASELVRLVPDAAKAHVTLARALQANGQEHEASWEARQALLVEPGNREAAALLSELGGAIRLE